MKKSLLLISIVCLLSFFGLGFQTNEDEGHYQDLGRHSLEEGDIQAAIEQYSNALANGGGEADAYVGRAIAYLIADERGKAFADCHRVDQLEPGGAQSIFCRGIKSWITGSSSDAHDQWSEAIELGAENVDMLRAAISAYIASPVSSPSNSLWLIDLKLALDELNPPPPSVEIETETITSQESTGVTVTVVADSLELYAGPSINYPVFDIVFRDDVFDVLGEAYGCAWVLVRTSNGAEGWLTNRRVMIDLSHPCRVLPAAKIPPLDSALKTVRVNVEELTVYREPSQDAQVRGVLQQGIDVEALAQRNACSWLLVRSPFGEKGWILSDGVSRLPVGDCQTLPVGGSLAFTAEVIGGFVVLYEADSADYNDVQIGCETDVLDVLGQYDHCRWLEVRAPDGTRSWTSGDSAFLALSEPCEQLPPAAELPPAMSQIQRYSPLRQDETRLYVLSDIDTGETLDVTIFTVVDSAAILGETQVSVTKHHSGWTQDPYFLDYEQLTDDAVLYHQYVAHTDGEVITSTYDSPMINLKEPLEVGEEWTSQTWTSDGLHLRESVEIVSRGSIEVSGVLYDDCLQVLQRRGNEPLYRSFYCPDLGLVAFEHDSYIPDIGWVRGELVDLANGRLELTVTASEKGDSCGFHLHPRGFAEDEYMRTVVYPPEGEPYELRAMPASTTVVLVMTPEDPTGLWMVECIGSSHRAVTTFEWSGQCLGESGTATAE